MASARATAPDAERLALEILVTHRVSRTPVDVRRLAREMGVAAIITAPLVEDGRLERLTAGTRVLVKDGMSDGRCRFTIAHELAHLLLETRGGAGNVLLAGAASAEIERFCDEFAAALLLPSDWLWATYRGRPKRLAVVREIAGAARTSVAAALIRMNSVFGWRRVLLRWQAVDGRWRLRAVAGAAADARTRLATAPACTAIFSSVSRRPGGSARVEIPLAFGDRALAVSADVWVDPGGGTALALFPAAALARAKP
jgi:hypothetical protein